MKTTKTTTATQTARIKELEAAIVKIAKMREDNDDWCLFCGEGHGVHEPGCVLTEIK